MDDDELRRALEERAERGVRRDPSALFRAASGDGRPPPALSRGRAFAAVAAAIVLVGAFAIWVGRGDDVPEQLTTDVADSAPPDVGDSSDAEAPATRPLSPPMDPPAGGGRSYALNLVLGVDGDCVFATYGDSLREVRWPPGTEIRTNPFGVDHLGVGHGLGSVFASEVEADLPDAQSCTGEGVLDLGLPAEKAPPGPASAAVVAVPLGREPQPESPVERTGVVADGDCLLVQTLDGSILPVWPIGTEPHPLGTGTITTRNGIEIRTDDEVTLSGLPGERLSRGQVFSDLDTIRRVRAETDSTAWMHCAYDEIWFVDDVTPVLPLDVDRGDSLLGRTFRGVDGQDVRLVGSSTRPMLVVFTASWCPPCREQLRELAAAVPELDNRVRVVVVLASETDVDSSLMMLDEAGLEPDVVVQDDDGGLVRDFSVLGLPALAATDAAGRLVAPHSGYMPALDIVPLALSGATEAITIGRCESDAITYIHDGGWITGFNMGCRSLWPLPPPEDRTNLVATGGTYALDTELGIDFDTAIGVFADDLGALPGDPIEGRALPDRTVRVHRLVVGEGGADLGYGEPGDRFLIWQVHTSDPVFGAQITLALDDVDDEAAAIAVAWRIAESIEF